MPKTALSITLDQDNLLWLRAQTVAARGKSLSDTLDQLVTAARQAGQVAEGSVRSVAGTIDISDDDPDLAGADQYVRSLFESIGPPAAGRAGAEWGGRGPRERRRPGVRRGEAPRLQKTPAPPWLTPSQTRTRSSSMPRAAAGSGRRARAV